MVKTFEIEFERAEKITPSVLELAFNISKKTDFSFKSGQFISLHLIKDDKELRRNYSIANTPDITDKIVFAAGHVEGGFATTLFYNLKQGDTLKASGPYGIFCLREENVPHYLLIATGTGVTPYRAMLPELAKLLQSSDLKITLVLGVRNREELLYSDDFLSFAEQHNNFEFIACYSRGMPEKPQSFERSGYVQTYLETLSFKGDEVAYLCGNPNMVDTVFQQLQDQGLARKHIRREKYISGR